MCVLVKKKKGGRLVLRLELFWLPSLVVVLGFLEVGVPCIGAVDGDVLGVRVSWVLGTSLGPGGSVITL